MLSNTIEWRFDWYRAGVYATPETIISALREYLKQDAIMYSLEQAIPQHGYQHAYIYTNGQKVLARIMFGGDNVGSATYVEFTGSSADFGAEFLRKRFPSDHHVMRVDAAIDFTFSKGYDHIVNEIIVPLAVRKNLACEPRGDWIHGKKGKTFYIGGRSSVAYARFYEKGKQLGGDADWLRLEFECKPKKLEQKLAAAHMTPLQLASSSKWAAELIKLLGQEPDVTQALHTSYEKTDKQRALEHMIKQYANTLSYFLETDPNFLEWLAAEVAANKTA